MPSPTTNAAEAYQEAARDCAGLITLLHRTLADHAASHRASPDWSHAGDLARLREALNEALLPTRNCLIEAEARAEIDDLIAQVRPDRV
jgi:hypothetical protein